MRLLLLIGAASLLTACNLPADLEATVSSSRMPTPTPVSDWQQIADGLSWRILRPNGDDLAQLIVVRIDQQHFRFRAIYSPGNPRRLSQWREQEPDAAVIINANFFDEANNVLGAVVSDGVVHGDAYPSYGGNFLVRNGTASVSVNRWDGQVSDDSIAQLAQGYPMLVDRGDPAYVRRADGQRTRRTLIAEDINGNILIMVSPYLGLSLADLSEYLTTAGLNILRAVNLDGGGSTMIALPAIDYFQASFDAVPTILAVYPRQS